jgi:ElaB/YqjD/DUF883 family membrane-anchored ribosome-binding protein
MNESKSMGDKVEALGANINDTVQDLIRDAKPLLNQATDRMSDRMSELSQQGIRAACQGKRDLENRGHDAAGHVALMIRHEPFKAMLIAAGFGAATVALVGILSRRHTHTHTQSH